FAMRRPAVRFRSAPPTLWLAEPARKRPEIKIPFTNPWLSYAMRLRLIPLWLSFLALASVTALAADEGEQKKPEHKTSQSKSYLSLEPIYTTIVSDNRAQGMLMVGIGLDVPSEELREVADRSMPVLRDAYVRNLMSFTAPALKTDAQPDVSM